MSLAARHHVTMRDVASAGWDHAAGLPSFRPFRTRRVFASQTARYSECPVRMDQVALKKIQGTLVRPWLLQPSICQKRPPLGVQFGPLLKQLQPRGPKSTLPHGLIIQIAGPFSMGRSVGGVCTGILSTPKRPTTCDTSHRARP